MSDEPANDTALDERKAGDEVYIIVNQQAQFEMTQGRRAAEWVPFLLPHLRAGQRLLDCGCGVGSITLDLAEIVAPGETVGVDRDEVQLGIARANAAARNLPNARFEQASIYELPFPDGSFDVALAHTLLFHLSDQSRALRELRRVLAPGGVVAISDDQWKTWVFSPEDSPARRVMTELGPQIILASGGNPYYSHNLRRLLLEAGFAQTQGFALAAEHYGTLADTRRFADIIVRQMREPSVVALVESQGLATAEELESLIPGVRAWGERPDAFAAVMYCAALGWVDPAP